MQESSAEAVAANITEELVIVLVTSNTARSGRPVLPCLQECSSIEAIMKKTCASALVFLSLSLGIAGRASADLAPPPDKDSGCDCSVAKGRGGSGTWLLCGALTGAAFLFRRRKRGY